MNAVRNRWVAWLAMAALTGSALAQQPVQPPTTKVAPGSGPTDAARRLTRPRPKPGITKIYKLQNTDAVQIATVLQRLDFEDAFDDSFYYRLTTAADARTNSVIVQGSPRLHEEAAKLIAELDVKSRRSESATAAAAEYQIRLVWLVNSVNKGEKMELPAPPEDLAPVVKELERLGFSGLSMAGQFIGRTRANAQFGMRGTVEFDRTFTVSVDGQAMPPTDEGLSVDFKIQAMGAPSAPLGRGPDDKRPLSPGPTCQVTATVNAPLGHFVVLGTSPTAQFNSIFVVQITEAKAVAPAAK